MTRESFAIFIKFVTPEVARKLYREYNLDRTLDRSYRGEGNAADRRLGLDTRRGSCGCVVCTVYGGDCAVQMWREGHTEWHRSKRGVKTRGV